MIHALTLMDFCKMLPTALTTYVVFDFCILEKQSETGVLALGNP